MGCFLVMTSGDLEQMQRSLKMAVSVAGGEPGGGVRIKVDETLGRSAREMAAHIRAAARSARVVNDDGRPVAPMKERVQLQVGQLAALAPGLAALFADVVAANYKTERAREGRRFGKQEGQEFAADMLVRSGYLAGQAYTITTGKGPDIWGVNNARFPVVIEVKTSGRPLHNDDFGLKMARGVYKSADVPAGFRQMDNGWLKHTHPDPNFDPAKAHVFGVFINTNTGVATLYHRVDADARRWDPIMTQQLPQAKLPPP